MANNWNIPECLEEEVRERDKNCVYCGVEFTPVDISRKSKEASRKKSLGELGELFAIKALIDNNYDKIVNFNDKKMNFPFADLYAEKEGKRFVISVKARNKYQKNRKLNAHYNLGGEAYKKAEMAEKEYCAEALWMAIQFDQYTYSIYLGSLSELNGKRVIPMRCCDAGDIGICLVKEQRHYFDFGYFGNKKDEVAQ